MLNKPIALTRSGRPGNPGSRLLFAIPLKIQTFRPRNREFTVFTPQTLRINIPDGTPQPWNALTWQIEDRTLKVEGKSSMKRSIAVWFIASLVLGGIVLIWRQSGEAQKMVISCPETSKRDGRFSTRRSAASATRSGEKEAKRAPIWDLFRNPTQARRNWWPCSGTICRRCGGGWQQKEFPFPK